MNKLKLRWISSLVLGALFVFAALSRLQAQGAEAPVGIFESHGDVGTVLHAGSVQYDASRGAYTVSGRGENMWLAADAFHFVWKKVSGDFRLTARLGRYGYQVTRQTGSHLRVTSFSKGAEHYVTVPAHKEIGVGTLQEILRDIASYLEIDLARLVEELFGS